MNDKLTEDLIKEKNQELYYYYRKIEDYFKTKEEYIRKYKHIPLEEILTNAPKYYPFINLVEKFNRYITRDQNWLKLFISRHRIKFDFDSYERWKANKKYSTVKYDHTQAPSKWIHILQEYFIDILESLQVLLIMEYYISTENYKKFLKASPEIFFKIKANFVRPSPPSEDIDKFLNLIDFLLDQNIQFDFLNNLTIDASLCMKVYRMIDNTKIFDLLKKKEFYIKYRLEYLKSKIINRVKIPYEEEVIKVAEEFMDTVSDLKLTYKEYKSRLMEKYNKVKYK